jgi:hypothetical protein
MARELCARTIGELNGGGDGPPDECPPVLARQARLSSATSSWALYFTYLTVISTAMLGWLWLLVWCVWKLV